MVTLVPFGTPVTDPEIEDVPVAEAAPGKNSNDAHTTAKATEADIN